MSQDLRTTRDVLIGDFHFQGPGFPTVEDPGTLREVHECPGRRKKLKSSSFQLEIKWLTKISTDKFGLDGPIFRCVLNSYSSSWTSVRGHEVFLDFIFSSI